MTLFQAEVLRTIGWHDNNFKPLASNDPATSTIGWTPTGGTPTSDGDNLTMLAGVNITKSGLSVSASTYPYFVIRAKCTISRTLNITVNGSGGSGNFTFATTPTTQTFSVSHGATGTITAVQIFTLSGSGESFSIDYAYLCGKPPLQLAATDLEFGTVTNGSMIFDSAQLKLNNLAGKFVSGTSAWNYGDHLHVYLPSIFSSGLSHRYGGYVEAQEPNMPPDEIWLCSRGFGLALGRTLHLNSYTGNTLQQIFNDFIDNAVNASAKNTVPIPSNYQITRSYVQGGGVNIPIYIVQQQSAFNSFRELVDLSTGLGSPQVFWVDPAENLHLVPLGAQGAASWGTDPLSALYPNILAVAKNQIHNQFRTDTQSIRTRVHYRGVEQTPGILDAWTENTAASWGYERVSGNTNTPTIVDVGPFPPNTPVALGQYSVHAQMVQANPASAAAMTAAFFYPAAKNLGLDLLNLGSNWTPPIFDFIWRPVYTSPANLPLFPFGVPPTVFFATDATSRFEYALLADQSRTNDQTILNDAAGSFPGSKNNTWQHILLPIGPHGGTIFLNPPTLNGIAPATYSGSSGFQLTNVGSPSWSNINYVGIFFSFVGNNSVGPNQTFDQYFDGWRILGGRYRLEYDGRSVANGRYPDMVEHDVFDPISKDPLAMKTFAREELLRLMNPILRGGLSIPMAGDMFPEQQVRITAPAANLSSTYLRVLETTHRFSMSGMITDVTVSNDFTNSQPLERWRVVNSLMGYGDNEALSKEVYDLKTAIFDPTFSPVLEHWTGSGWMPG